MKEIQMTNEIIVWLGTESDENLVLALDLKSSRNCSM